MMSSVICCTIVTSRGESGLCPVRILGFLLATDSNQNFSRLNRFAIWAGKTRVNKAWMLITRSPKPEGSCLPQFWHKKVCNVGLACVLWKLCAQFKRASRYGAFMLCLHFVCVVNVCCMPCVYIACAVNTCCMCSVHALQLLCFPVSC